jgi:hypothetical protein
MLKGRIIDTVRIPRGGAIFQDGRQVSMEGRVNTFLQNYILVPCIIFTDRSRIFWIEEYLNIDLI